MKMIIKTSDERSLEVGSKIIPLKWCMVHQTWEAYCDINILKGETGESLPIDVMICLTENGRMDFPPFSGGVISRHTEDTTPICVRFSLPWEGRDFIDLRKKLFEYTVSHPNRKYIEKLLEHFLAIVPDEDLLSFEKHITIHQDFYSTINTGLEFSRKIFEQT
jgi:hypothetical protein